MVFENGMLGSSDHFGTVSFPTCCLFTGKRTGSSWTASRFSLKLTFLLSEVPSSQAAPASGPDGTCVTATATTTSVGIPGEESSTVYH